MHACGHDGHTAIVLALAEFAGKICPGCPIMFCCCFSRRRRPPAAQRSCARPEFCRPVGSSGFSACICGRALRRGGLVPSRSADGPRQRGERRDSGRKRPHLQSSPGRDALTAGMEYLQRVYTMVETELPEREPRVLRFGKMESGTVRNAVSGRTLLLGTMRTYSDDAYAFLKRRLCEIGGAVAEETGCTVSVRVNEGYPAVMNDAALLAELQRQLGRTPSNSCRSRSSRRRTFVLSAGRAGCVFLSGCRKHAGAPRQHLHV